MSNRRSFVNGSGAAVQAALTQRPKIQASTKPFFWAGLQPDGVLELLIYEDIGEGWWDSGLTGKTIRQQIDQAGTFSSILMRINSQGGDPFEACAIYNLVRAQKKPVEVRVDGVAASSASIIAMAGDDIIMGPNATMMIHNASSFCGGFASDMRKMAEALDVVSGAIAQTYVTRTRKELKDVLALMDAETWMTAQDAVAQGFASEVAPEADEPAVEALAMARQQFRALKGFKNVPAALITAGVACTCDCQNCIDGDCENCTNQDCNDGNCLDCPMQEATSARATLLVARRMAARASSPGATPAAKTTVSPDLSAYEQLLNRMDRDRPAAR